MFRQGEKSLEVDRSDRVFQKGDYWYYKTREKVSIGPFDDYSAAEKGVNDFIEFICQADLKAKHILEQYRQNAA